MSSIKRPGRLAIRLHFNPDLPFEEMIRQKATGYVEHQDIETCGAVIDVKDPLILGMKSDVVPAELSMESVIAWLTWAINACEMRHLSNPKLERLTAIITPDRDESDYVRDAVALYEALHPDAESPVPMPIAGERINAKDARDMLIAIRKAMKPKEPGAGNDPAPAMYMPLWTWADNALSAKQQCLVKIIAEGGGGISIADAMVRCGSEDVVSLMNAVIKKIKKTGWNLRRRNNRIEAMQAM